MKLNIKYANNIIHEDGTTAVAVVVEMDRDMYYFLREGQNWSHSGNFPFVLNAYCQLAAEILKEAQRGIV